MDPVTEALVTVRKARHKEEAVRDVLPAVGTKLKVSREEDHGALQRIFEAPYAADYIMKMSKSARSTVFYTALESGGTLTNIFNEYASYMTLVKAIMDEPIANWERPSNALASSVLEANNPLGTAFSILRSQKQLSPSVTASVLEAAFPLAVSGLSEATRDKLFALASDRGVNALEVANAYVPLVELVADVRFLEDSDELTGESSTAH